MSEAFIIRRYVSRDFTHLANELIRDVSISWKALGILVYLLSLPPDFRLRLCHLSSLRAGRDATRAGLKELEAAGYLSIERQTGTNGRFCSTVWRVSDIPFNFPCSENPNVENPNAGKATAGEPYAVKPSSEKPTLLRTEKQKELKKKITNTKKQRVSGRDWDVPSSLLDGLTGLSSEDVRAISLAISSIPEEDVRILLGVLSDALKAGNVIRTTPGQWFAGVVRRRYAKSIALSGRAAIHKEQEALECTKTQAGRRAGTLALAQLNKILGGKASNGVG